MAVSRRFLLLATKRLSRGPLECPHDMAVGSSCTSGPREQDRNCSVSYDQAPKVTLCHFCNILVVTHSQRCPAWEETAHGPEYPEARILDSRVWGWLPHSALWSSVIHPPLPHVRGPHPLPRPPESHSTTASAQIPQSHQTKLTGVVSVHSAWVLFLAIRRPVNYRDTSLCPSRPTYIGGTDTA